MSDRKGKAFSKGYRQGFTDGFGDGFHAGFEMAMEKALLMLSGVSELDDLEDLIEEDEGAPVEEPPTAQ
ncbi:MAG: hypothetical protein ACOX9R_10725 [Armatimonadota bacterium]|jgi:hypothetical protein